MSTHESLREQVDPSRAPLDRCARCALHLRLCLCGFVQPIALPTRVVVLRHRRELYKPTNTGRLVPLTLAHGEVRSFGDRGVELEIGDLLQPERRPLLLYPSADSRPLTRAVCEDGPVTLIVPDADWRRAFKLATREPALASVPRVHLPSGPPSEYRLRRHMNPRFVATFEAVARALGILEGPEVQARLEYVFRVMVERTLWSRGQIATEDVTGGLPEPLPRASTDAG
ncbi:MAG: DTW domain-containing protein [Planctomycetota bacterium]|nr:DTW domain-containing protein [Planctomycetota bacterium]